MGCIVSSLVVFFLFANVTGAAPAAAPDWQQLRQEARISDSQGDFGRGEMLFRRAEVLTRSQSEADHFVALEDLGNHYFELADFSTAARYFRAGLKLVRQMPAGKPAAISPAIALDNLGAVLRRMGAFTEAQPLAAEAATRYAALGMVPDTAHSYAALGEIALGLGEPDRARAELKTATELLAGIRYSTMDAARTLVWAAQSYLALGNPNEAGEALDQAETMMGHLQPVDAQDQARFADTKGSLLYRERHYAEAERLWNQVLQEADPQTVIGHAVRIHLAELYNDLGRYQDAEPLLSEVILHDHGEPVARGVAESEMGQAMLREKQPDAADAMFQSAISDLEGSEAHKLPALAVAYARYASLREQQRRWEDALSYFQRAITINRMFSPRDPATVAWLLDCGNLYRRVGNRKAAADCKAQARALLSTAHLERRETVDLRELETQRN